MGNDVVANDRPRRSNRISALFVLGLLVLTCCVAIASVCALSAMEEAYINHRREGLSKEQLKDTRTLWLVGKTIAVIGSLLLAIGSVCCSESIGWRVTFKAAPGPMSPSDREFFLLLVLVYFACWVMPSLTLFVMHGIGEACIRGRGKGIEEAWADLTGVVTLASILFAFLPVTRKWIELIRACDQAAFLTVSHHPASKEVKTSNDVGVENIV